MLLRFDEHVSTVAGSLRVLDASAEPVAIGKFERPSDREVAASLPDDLADGTYIVGWRVLSEDAHPIHGAFAFAVREELGDVSGVVEQALDADAGSGVLGWVHAVSRFAALALALLAIGGAGLLALVLGPEERPRRVVWRAVLLASLGLVLATLVWAAATAAQSVGSGLDGLLRWAPLGTSSVRPSGTHGSPGSCSRPRSPGRRRTSSSVGGAAPRRTSPRRCSRPASL